MRRFLDLLVDTQSPAGLAVSTLTIVVVAVVLRLGLVPLVRRRFHDDPYRRYWSGKVTTYVLAAIAVVALLALWAPLGGRLSVILGFATAGIAFAMQEVIGALFGWVNILAGASTPSATASRWPGSAETSWTSRRCARSSSSSAARRGRGATARAG